MELVDASTLQLPFPATGLVAVMLGRDILGLPLESDALGEWLREPGRRIAGMVVRGDLRAKYPITNIGPEGPFLWVQGDLKAPAVVTRTSEVLIEGDVEAAMLSGPIEVQGDVRAKVLQGGRIRVHGAVAALLALGEVQTDPGSAVIAFRSPEVLRDDLRDEHGVAMRPLLRAIRLEQRLLKLD